jgi:hypothetical protein
MHSVVDPRERTVVRHRGSVSAAIAELVSSGAGVLAVCADASRRAALAGGASGLARFNGGSALIACHRCGGAAVTGLARRAESGLALVDYPALASAPELAGRFEHLVLVDPPAGPGEEALLATAYEGGSGGFRHELCGAREYAFALAVEGTRMPSRQVIASAFRRLRDAGEAGDAELRGTLAGAGEHPLCPRTAARCVRVLRDLDLVRGEPNGGDGVVGVVSSEGTDLERSAAFRAYSEEHSEAQQYLERPKQP